MNILVTNHTNHDCFPHWKMWKKCGNDDGNDHATPRNGGIQSTINSVTVIMVACGGTVSPKYDSLNMLPYQVYHGLLGYGFMTFLGTARMPTASFQKDSLLSESSFGNFQFSKNLSANITLQ